MKDTASNPEAPPPRCSQLSPNSPVDPLSVYVCLRIVIVKLKTLTNLSVVRDEESSTSWNVEVRPFPGWADVPTW